MTSPAAAPHILVDGSSYLYRAFHAMSQADLKTASGFPTGAIRGVTSMLRRLQKDYPDSLVIVVFDAKGKTFRSDIYADYKANRPPMPDELRQQVEPVNDIVKAMGLPLVSVPGVEADDVIGTMARLLTERNKDCVISTGDKDLAQLVNSKVTLVNTMTETLMDEPGVIEKFGVPATQVIDFLALMGDKVDNIPGVPGVGQKTALALLNGIGGLDEIYANLDQVATLDVRGAKKLGEKLKEHEASARLSYELATIKVDVELTEEVIATLDANAPQAADSAALLELFKRFEFKTWTSQLESSGAAAVGESGSPEAAYQPPAETIYETILDKKSYQQCLKRLAKEKTFAFDTETTSLDVQQARVVGISFCSEPGKAFYVPFGHDYMDAPTQLDEATVLGGIKSLLEDSSIAKIGQNLKYDQQVLFNHDIFLQGIGDDTMLMSYVIDSTGKHDMDSLADNYLDIKTTHYEDIAGKGAKQLTFNQIPLEQAGPYAAEDADITLRLQQLFQQKLAGYARLQKLYKELELPLVEIISRVETNGAMIDGEMLLEQSAALDKRMAELTQEAYKLAGEEFNLASPKQLQAILFEKLKIPVLKKTPKGQPSTAEPVLQELALDYPLPAVIMEYRSLSKLKTTYTDRLPEQISEKTGRVHTSYHQAVTATGRLSSSDPNLQNIPIRTDEGRRVRQAFIAPKKFKIVAADYSQIELRIMAHLSKDKGLLEAFNQGLDVHKATASEVFGVSLEAVSQDQRRKAKAINFGLIYGMSAFGLARQLDISRGDAQLYIDRYFDRYPGVLRYMNETRTAAAEQGYVETLFGRRLYLPEINASNGMRRQAAERTAINAPMQGTAADIIKRAMIDVDRWIAEQQKSIKMIMQVHDELVFEIPEKEVEQEAKTICELMSSAAELSVPLIVDAGIGKNWDEAH